MADDKNEAGPPKGKGAGKGVGGKAAGDSSRTGRPNWSQRSRGATPVDNTPFARPQVPGADDPGEGESEQGPRGSSPGSAPGDARGGSVGGGGRGSLKGGAPGSFGESALGLARAGMRGARGQGRGGRSAGAKSSMKEEAKSQAKGVAKKVAVKAATGAISGATGIPQPIVEGVARHWKIALAALLIVPSLLIFALFIVVSGSYNESDSSNAACASAAALVSSSASTTPGTPPPPAQLSLFLAAERWTESRNNYADASAGAIWDAHYAGGTLEGSGAFGAYQYIQPTWYSYATSAGVSAYAGDNPAKLPSSVSDAVQDQVANWEFTRDYKQDSANPADTGNIWMWVAEQHFDSTYAVPADQNVAPGDNGGETMADYGNTVVGYMTTEPWLNASSNTTTTDSAQADYSGSCNATELSGPLADQIIEEANGNLGLTQVAGNIIYGPNAWGPDGEEWCAFFASWVLDQAGVTPPPGSVPNVGVLENILVSGGGTQLAPTDRPQPGDLVFFGSPADPLHVAIVDQVLSNGDIAVIGGNEGSNDSTASTVDQSTPFAPASAQADGWPGPIWAFVQPAGV